MLTKLAKYGYRIKGRLKRFVRALSLLSWVLFFLTGCQPEGVDTSPGVSRKLAEHRAKTLSNIRYDLRLSIPDSVHQKIRGELSVHFDLKTTDQPVVLDFTGPRESVLTVVKDRRLIPYHVTDEHIIIPRSVFEKGPNSIEMVFWAGEGSLNRNQDYLYTLFVPDRARFAFPCFDQPNLKARFRLALNIPPHWRAVANSPLHSRHETESHVKYVFTETEPISTYLFSFAAGEFQIETARRSGRELNMYHRETDAGKVARNLEAIFDLHDTALEWLEEYTDIPYPFSKFDFVLIPSFQYGGMEHPGAVLYRASSLLLDESATQDRLLRRASVIAHETAHMWFGDLVTMDWFNDVWMKEVFANFMAAKIVNPSFPKLDHELRFLLAHYPAAYEVDRTEGSNPIRQELENLNEAGTLYGAIIYQKAPIVMKHLENMMGKEAFRDGLREYLKKFEFDNATWSDLITILDNRTEEDLATWSHIWVEEPGRPIVSVERTSDAMGKIAKLVLTQADPLNRQTLWPQRVNVLLGRSDSRHLIPASLNGATTEIREATGMADPDFVLVNGAGLGYGLFKLDNRSLDYLSKHLPSIDSALVRGIAWISLWDAVLEARLAPENFLQLTLEALETERDELNIQGILDYLERAYWRFLGPNERGDLAPQIEALLWRLIEQTTESRRKAAYFNTFRDISIGDENLARLIQILRGERQVPGLKLSEQDLTTLAFELAVRGLAGWKGLLAIQRNRITNPDRKQRFEFIAQALSDQPEERDAFFDSLQDATNRAHEPWVLRAVEYLHHPLRASQSEKYVLPSLGLLEEIQQTGDIFFPKRWLDATFSGHQTEGVAKTVREFLSDRPDYPPKLRGKILQSADELFRAAAILGKAGKMPN